MGFQTQACGMTLGSILGILALLGFLNGEMEMAIGCPRNILWVYEIFVYKVPSTYLAHCRCSQNRSNNSSERLSLPPSEVPCDPGFTLSLISKLLSEPGLVHPIADSISCSGNRSHHPTLPFMDFDKDN